MIKSLIIMQRKLANNLTCQKLKNQLEQKTLHWVKMKFLLIASDNQKLLKKI